MDLPPYDTLLPGDFGGVDFVVEMDVKVEEASDKEGIVLVQRWKEHKDDFIGIQAMLFDDGAVMLSLRREESRKYALEPFSEAAFCPEETVQDLGSWHNFIFRRFGLFLSVAVDGIVCAHLEMRTVPNAVQFPGVPLRFGGDLLDEKPGHWQGAFRNIKLSSSKGQSLLQTDDFATAGLSEEDVHGEDGVQDTEDPAAEGVFLVEEEAANQMQDTEDPAAEAVSLVE
jgi:hypothetical protein